MGLNERKSILEKQGYRLIGNHSALKTCQYCKTAIKGTDVCYKNKFYGINSWRCIQATVTLDVCSLRCQWCWRDIDYNAKKASFLDNPKDILDEFIKEQRKALIGYFGYDKINKKRLLESTEPKHVALSLTGDACLYPRLPELIDLIHEKGMTSFVVTNGTFPEMVKKLAKHQPTQIYITLPAPDEETFSKVCRPLDKNAWNKIIISLGLLKHFKRGTIRLTLYKGINMIKPEEYAALLRNVGFKFLEVKAAMPVGYAQYRLKYEDMPLHKEIKEFSMKIARLNNLKIIDEKENSRVVLLMKKDSKDRFLKF